MARIVAVFDDLLLGSNVQGMLRAAGHDVQLSGGGAADPEGADVLVVDLAAGTFDGVELVERLRAAGSLGQARDRGLLARRRRDARAGERRRPRPRRAAFAHGARRRRARGSPGRGCVTTTNGARLQRRVRR
jgi:hypothetical protein